MEQTKPLYSGMQKGVEKSTKEGESPVVVIGKVCLKKQNDDVCQNTGGPPSRSKYAFETNSEQVP